MREAIPHTLGDLVRRAAVRWGDRVAFTFGERTTTFAQLDSITNQVANRLRAEGIGKGDRIAYLGKNTDIFFRLHWGAAKLGVVLVPVNWRLAPLEAAYVINDAEAILLFAAEGLASAVSGLCSVRKTITLEGATNDPASFAAWIEGASTDDLLCSVEPDDVILQLYTSGTTGHPKGAMLTGDSLIHIRTAQPPGAVWSSWSDDEAVLLSMPLFHIGGVGLSLNGLVFGARMFILQEFNPKVFLDHIAKDGVTRLFIVPAALKLLLQEPTIGEVDFSRLRCIAYGSSPISLELLRECLDVFKCSFVQNYGLTETCGTVVTLPPADHDPQGSPRMLSAGRAIEGVELGILDPSGHPLPAGEIGEIALRTRANMKGYWKLPEVTRATISDDGWLHTGDAGYLDEDGYLFIQDRLKDVIISGGENIYPAEVERVLNDHPDIAECVVFGIPDVKWGEAVHAVTVWREGVMPDVSGLSPWLKERLASYKLPKAYSVADSLPRNATGKVMRRDLREPYWAGQARRVG